MANELSSGIKNVAETVKKAENLELYSTLLDLYEKALELQDENRELKDRLADRDYIESIRMRIIRHDQPVITLKDDEDSVLYCAHCWDSKEKLIQVNTKPSSAEFNCPSCKNEGVYDSEKHEQYIRYNRARRKGVSYL